MTLEQLKHLFQQIAKTPPQDYDSQMLQLVKKFTLHAFTKQKKEADDDAKPQWFGLDLLWKFVQTSDTAQATKRGKKRKIRRLVSEKVAREALQLFLELLSTEYAISQREMYMEKCIWHIQESSKVVQNLILLQRLIQTFPMTHRTWYGTNTTAHQNTQAGVIERLEKDYAIIDHLLQVACCVFFSMDTSLQTAIFKLLLVLFDCFVIGSCILQRYSNVCSSDNAIRKRKG